MSMSKKWNDSGTFEASVFLLDEEKKELEEIEELDVESSIRRKNPIMLNFVQLLSLFSTVCNF